MKLTKYYQGFTEEEMLSRSDAFYTLMKVRRSVRKFSKEKVPRKIIENIIKTAGTSPSGANCQPWRFVVITNPILFIKSIPPNSFIFFQTQSSRYFMIHLKNNII